jgi:hypothetical protein
MRRLSILAVPAVLVLGLSACGGGGYDTETVKAKEKDTNDFGFNDAPPKAKITKQGPDKLSPGDQLSFRSLMLQGGKQVGEFDVNCSVVHGGNFDTARTQCTGTAGLAGGQLSLMAGVTFGNPVVSGAIVGGTGKYKGAGGTFTSHNHDNAPNDDTFEIQIPKK